MSKLHKHKRLTHRLAMRKESFHAKKFDTLQILFQMLKKIYLNAQNGSIVFFPCLLEKVFKFSKFFHELFPC